MERNFVRRSRCSVVGELGCVVPPSCININIQDIWLLTRHHEIPEESISGGDESSTTVSRSQTTISRDVDDNQGAGVGVIGEINPETCGSASY